MPVGVQVQYSCRMYNQQFGIYTKLMLNVHVHVKYMDFVWHLLWMKPAEWPLACILIAGLQMYKVHIYFVLCTKVHAWQFSCHGNYKWCLLYLAQRDRNRK